MGPLISGQVRMPKLLPKCNRSDRHISFFWTYDDLSRVEGGLATIGRENDELLEITNGLRGQYLIISIAIDTFIH